MTTGDRLQISGGYSHFFSTGHFCMANASSRGNIAYPFFQHFLCNAKDKMVYHVVFWKTFQNHKSRHPTTAGPAFWPKLEGPRCEVTVGPTGKHVWVTMFFPRHNSQHSNSLFMSRVSIFWIALNNLDTCILALFHIYVDILMLICSYMSP